MVDLHRDYGISTTSNVADLGPYMEDNYLVNLRENSLQQCRMMDVHQGSKI